MMAVFDVKDRMLDRAQRRAHEIQDEAGKTASSLLAEVQAARGREPELEVRISTLEHELVQTRANGERLRTQLNDAHNVINSIESTTTVDITTLQVQLNHEQQQNAELRAAAREVDYVRREYEDKLAQAQQLAMHARAELEIIRAELDTRAAAATTSEETAGTVVYERSSTTEDLDFIAATGALEGGLSQAI